MLPCALTSVPLAVSGDVSLTNMNGADVPLGAGLTTVIFSIPAVGTSAVTITACNCVELTTVVARSDPSDRTVAPCTKPVPVMVIVKLVPPRSL